MARTPRPPALVHHKPTGQGRVRMDGKNHYLGPFGSPECDARYEEILHKLRLVQTVHANLRVDVLAVQYLDQCEGYYRRPDGTPTGVSENVRDSLKPLVALFGRKHVPSPGSLLERVEIMG